MNHPLTFPLPVRMRVTEPDGGYSTKRWTNEELHAAIMAGGHPPANLDGDRTFALECVERREVLCELMQRRWEGC